MPSLVRSTGGDGDLPDTFPTDTERDADFPQRRARGQSGGNLRKERDDLAKEMTPAQVAQAEAEAASWRPTATHSTWPLAPDDPSHSNAWPHHP